MPTALPSTISDVILLPDPDAGDRFYFGLEEPGPKRDAMGRPVLMMLPAGGGARLQMAVRWAVSNDTLEEVRRGIADAMPDLDPVDVRLAPLPMSVDAVRVVLSPAEGEESILAESASSGSYPYDALFNLTLNAREATLVLRALHGEEGVLQVRYEARLHVPMRVEARIQGDASDLIARIDGREEDTEEDLTELRRRVDEAIASGRLHEAVDMEGPDAVVDSVRNQARDAAAAILLSVLRDEEPRDRVLNLEATAQMSESDAVPVEAVTDVATWLDARMLKSLVHVQPGDVDPGESPSDEDLGADDDPGTEPPDAEVRSLAITTDVDLGDAGIREVRVQHAERAESSVVIRSGDNAATLSRVPPASRLRVDVVYRGFGSDYSVEIDAPSADDESVVHLSAGDLGVAQVRIDATALDEGGVQQARVSVRYVPSEDGDRHQETVQLRHDTWTASWYVVTRAPDLAGTLRVDVITSGPDGRERRQFEAEDSLIEL
jgi:hypothetical protein